MAVTISISNFLVSKKNNDNFCNRNNYTTKLRRVLLLSDTKGEHVYPKISRESRPKIKRKFQTLLKVKIKNRKI